MKPTDEDELLRDLLADQNLETLRAKSLAVGLASLRARRRMRRVVGATVLAAATLVAVLGLVATRYRQTSPVETVEVTPSSLPSRVVQVIDDEQLLALFPDRAVALVGAAGQQKLLFLDGRAGAAAAGKNR